jgi:CshA-type fibril repeat protein
MKSFCIPTPAKKHKPLKYSQCLALEARLVFDGAAVATAVEAQNTTTNDANSEPVSVVAAIAPDVAAVTVDFLPETTPQAIDFISKGDPTGNQSEFFAVKESAFVPAAITAPASAIIVVDPRADNAALLYLNPPVNTQVVVLDAARDGFQQIAELLQTRHEVTELHIVPWMQNHQEWLGSQSLTATLESSVSNSLMDWNDGLSDNAQLVFHGQDSMGAGWLNHLSALTNAQTSWSTESPFNQDNSTPSLGGSSATTLIFIDSAVQDAADIISAADKNAEIVYLDANSDGLTQIADYLEGRTNIDSIQIISHGKDAALYLGNESIDNANLASHAAQLATIGQSLTANGDILLYGCDVAQSAAGEKFVDSIASLTQADVAASTDITGATNKGGNWTLEYTAGTIEASILAAAHYQDILAMPVFDVNNGTLLFNQPSIQRLDGQAAGSVILFTNVITINGQQIDAVVTIVDNVSTTIDALDTAVPGTPALGGAPGVPAGNDWFDFTVQELAPVPVATDLSTIRFDFIQGGSYNNVTNVGVDVLLKNVVVNSYDIDNGQFQHFSGFSSYVISNTTQLSVSALPNNFTRFQSVTGQSNNAPITDPLADQFRVTAFYDQIHTFEIKTGSNISASPAYFYLDFSLGLAWNNPANDPPVNTVPTVQTVNAGVQTDIPGLSVTDINHNLASTRLSVGSGVLNVDLTGGATISNGANGTGILTLSGTETQIKAALATVKYTANNNGINNDTLSILSTDKLGLTDLDTVAINVTNSPPIAVDDTKTGNAGTPIIVNVVGNDSDPNNNLDPTSVRIVGTANPGDPLFIAGQGTWSVNTVTGDITFTPIAGFILNPAPINYTVRDTTGLESATAKVTVLVNNPPIAVSDHAIGVIGTPVTVNVLGNDRDPDGNLDSTSVQIVGAAPDGTLVVPNQGTWSVNTSTGEITFTPVAGFADTPTPINYTVKDSNGSVSTAATVTITMNQVPIAIPDSNVATEGGRPITGDIITNEATLGDRPTIVTAASQGVNNINIGVPFITAAGAVLIINADGSYSYTPPRSIAINGLTERFNYTITDSNGDTSNSILTIVIQKALGASGSLIQLSNPARAIEEELPKFFTTPPLQPATVLDFSLYTKLYPLPSHDNIISLTGSLRDQVVLELKHFSFDVPSWAFRHTNPNEQLHFEASYPDGSPLPEWLKFNPKLLIFSGTPPKGAHNETVMVTASDAYGNEVHAVFTVHVNKERISLGNKSLNLDLKLMGISDKAIEKHQHHEKSATVGKSGLSDRIHAAGKLGKLQESHALLESLKHK